MKTKLKKSPALYVGLALLLLVSLLGIGYLTVDAVTELINKRRLVNGVQIVATVTDRKSHFNIVKGGGSASYEIDYEFQYTDRRTGKLQKQVRTSYPVYKNEYETYKPGSTFTASFIPSEPTVSEPSATVGRLSPQSVLLIRLMTSLVALGAVAALVWKFLPGLRERTRHSRKLVGVAVVLSSGVVVAGVAAGAGIVQFIENLLLT